jgi:hypothetical protein
MKPDHVLVSMSSSLKNETKFKPRRLVLCFVSSSLKNETRGHEHSSFPVSSSLKNETITSPIESSLLLQLVVEPSFHPPWSVDPLSSSLSGEHFSY